VSLFSASDLRAADLGRRVAIFGFAAPWAGFVAAAIAAVTLARLADHSVTLASAGLSGLPRTPAVIIALGSDAGVQAAVLALALAWAWRARRGARAADAAARASELLRAIAFVAVSVILAAFLEESTHLLLSRPRPTVFLATGVDEMRILGLRIFGKWGSFPSGHSARGFALVAALWIVMPGRPWLRAVLVITALASCAQVLMLRHFVSDVVAGAFLGVATPSLLAAPFVASARRAAVSGE
jgi:membrane-associated phospholipid phosphatase